LPAAEGATLRRELDADFVLSPPPDAGRAAFSGLLQEKFEGIRNGARIEDAEPGTALGDVSDHTVEDPSGIGDLGGHT
jgi:hypothetical protein